MAEMVCWRRVAGDGGSLFVVMMKSSWLMSIVCSVFASTLGRLSASVVYKATGIELHKPRGLPSIGSLGNMKLILLGDRKRSPFGW